MDLIKMDFLQVCSLLLASLESLQRTLIEFSNLLSENKAKSEAKMSVTDCRKRLNNLSDMAKVINKQAYVWTMQREVI